ncbi:hypothetical protein BH09PSE1_BH09PSE1_03690 [soil metagenome]
MKKIVVAGLVALIAVSASACGRMADLEAPAPRKTERAPRDAWAPNLPDPATSGRPSSRVPIDGGPSNPLGAPPPIDAPN